MNLIIKSYQSQTDRWPKEGKHILAQFDEDSIIVYQAYRPSIGHYAAKHHRFGGEYGFNRMSWIKPNFLWMMYRCGWAQKPDQEVVLAIRMHRWAFDEILRQAVHSNFVQSVYAEEHQWKQAVANSDVRLQWDPDHGPKGEALNRRAIQLGLRGQMLTKFGTEWIVEVQDISDYVRTQHQYALRGEWRELLTPSESVYPISDAETARKLEVSHAS